MKRIVIMVLFLISTLILGGCAPAVQYEPSDKAIDALKVCVVDAVVTRDIDVALECAKAVVLTEAKDVVTTKLTFYLAGLPSDTLTLAYSLFGVSNTYELAAKLVGLAGEITKL